MLFLAIYRVSQVDYGIKAIGDIFGIMISKVFCTLPSCVYSTPACVCVHMNGCTWVGRHVYILSYESQGLMVSANLTHFLLYLLSHSLTEPRAPRNQESSVGSSFCYGSPMSVFWAICNNRDSGKLVQQGFVSLTQVSSQDFTFCPEGCI